MAALAILYSRPHAARRLTYAMLEELHAAMSRPPWELQHEAVWACVGRLHSGQVRYPAKALTKAVPLSRIRLVDQRLAP